MAPIIMADELTPIETQVEAPQPQPVDPPTEEVKDPGALLRAYERQKAENNQLKQQTDKLTELLEQVRHSLTYPEPQQQMQMPDSAPAQQAPVPARSKAQQLLETFQVNEQLEKFVNSARQQEREAAERALQAQIREATEKATRAETQLQETLRRQAIQDAFNRSGGLGAEFANFYALAGNRLRIENNKVVGVLTSDGQPLYKDGKPVDPGEWMAQIRQGQSESGAIRACFVPWNQSSGGGSTPPVGITTGGNEIYPLSQMERLMAEKRKEGKNDIAWSKTVKWDTDL